MLEAGFVPHGPPTRTRGCRGGPETVLCAPVWSGWRRRPFLRHQHVHQGHSATLRGWGATLTRKDSSSFSVKLADLAMSQRSSTRGSMNSAQE